MQGLQSVPFSQVAKTMRLDDEMAVSDREAAAKRFIDVLFLANSGDLTLRQADPLHFSEITLDINSSRAVVV